MREILLNFLIILFFSSGSAYFTRDFRQYLERTKGKEIADLLERAELRENGSFGGRNRSEKINHQPVLLVHGAMSHIWRFYPIKHFFHRQGYSEAEVYGTTWGNPDDSLIDVTIRCESVKQLRLFLESIHNYTKKKVDVIGYSMGSVIVRKAILGGNCEGEEIGGPLTSIIDTFLSVAGSNLGSSYCDDYPYFDVCNPTNGLSCESAFLKELNSQQKRFEGRFSFAIASDFDEKIGEWCCGKKCASLPNSNQEFWGYEANHDNLMIGSARLQYELLTEHRRVKAKLVVKMKKTAMRPNYSIPEIEWENSSNQSRQQNLGALQSMPDSMKSKILESLIEWEKKGKAKVIPKDDLDYEDLVKKDDLISKNLIESSIDGKSDRSKILEKFMKKTGKGETPLAHKGQYSRRKFKAQNSRRKPIFDPLSLLFSSDSDVSFGISGGPNLLNTGKIDPRDILGISKTGKATVPEEISFKSTGIIGGGGRKPEDPEIKDLYQERDYGNAAEIVSGYKLVSEDLLDYGNTTSLLAELENQGSVKMKSHERETGPAGETENQGVEEVKASDFSEGYGKDDAISGGRWVPEAPDFQAIDHEHVNSKGRGPKEPENQGSIQGSSKDHKKIKVFGGGGRGPNIPDFEGIYAPEKEKDYDNDMTTIIKGQVPKGPENQGQLQVISKDYGSQVLSSGSGARIQETVEIVRPKFPVKEMGYSGQNATVEPEIEIEGVRVESGKIIHVKPSEIIKSYGKDRVNQDESMKNLILEDLPDRIVEVDAPKEIEMTSLMSFDTEPMKDPRIPPQKKHSTHKLPIKKFKKRKNALSTVPLANSPQLYEKVVEFLEMKKQKQRKTRKTKRSSGKSKKISKFSIHNYPINRLRKVRKQRSTGRHRKRRGTKKRSFKFSKPSDLHCPFNHS